jgi:thiamine-phosphate pyrophosphorylase
MRPQLYYITDRSQFPGKEEEQERHLLAKIAECAEAGVDYIQLREKDLSTRALEGLAHKARAALAGSTARLLINSRTDMALACGAHGVHLPGDDLPASEVRAIFARANVVAPVIAASVHSLAEAAYAEAHGADFAVFAPVFEKDGTKNPAGLDQLRQICRRREAAAPPMPVFALGGVTLENARQCLEAGAAGIAGIRLFQDKHARSVVEKLRGE